MLQPLGTTSLPCCAARVCASRLVAASVAPDLKPMDEQIGRMRLIVNQPLLFARTAEFAGWTKPLRGARPSRSAIS